MTAPLSDLVVLEVSGDVATRYCGKLFAEHGARVVSAFEPDNAHIGYGGQLRRPMLPGSTAGRNNRAESSKA